MPEAIDQLARRLPALQPIHTALEAAFSLLRDAFADGHRLWVCGNGGSAADAEHIVGELVKGFMRPRRLPDDDCTARLREYPTHGAYLADRLQGGLPAISLCGHPALQSAWANDVGAALFFAQQVHIHGRPGDVLWVLSTSGRSINILHAMRVARWKGLRTLGLGGPTGGEMGPWCDVLICAPGESTPLVQEHHLPIYHALCLDLESHFFSR